MPGNDHRERSFYRIGYTAGAFEFLSRAAERLGRKGSGLIGRTAGRFYAATNPGIVDVIRRNLEILENRPFSRKEAARMFETYGLTLADYLWMGSRAPGDGFAMADLDGGIENIRGAMENGRGAILVTGHFGFFEFGALVLGHMGLPVSVVTYAEPSPELTRWRADFRRRWGAETIELGADSFSSLRVNQALEDGRLTAMLVDRPVGGRSLDVALPGGSIAFSMSPAILSWMTGCAIIPVTAWRTPAGRYAIRGGTPIVCDRSKPRNEEIEATTRRMAATLVEAFRADPLQWYQFVPLQS
ncbi:MAG: lysophospholipid acyltransferase family protein [Terrimicrobiaceae bacterium]|nr:lysophospholipid acyltransferase family protein [Terrimicrobiaceae bacterium]